MMRIINGGEKIRNMDILKVISDRAPGPFSWLNYVVLRKQDLDDVMAWCSTMSSPTCAYAIGLIDSCMDYRCAPMVLAGFMANDARIARCA